MKMELQAALHMVPVSDRTRVSRAFAKLRRRGWFAAENFSCCTTCGMAEAPNDRPIVFWHEQEEARAWNAGGNIEDRLHLCFDPQTEKTGHHATEIVAALANQGLGVEWNGDERLKIQVFHIKRDPNLGAC